jgi:predicted Rossmann fold nucleotide-binding protein DprA/Smf involved in DNA uptake
LITTAADDGPWLDEQAGRLVRPYTVSNGRTRPTADLDLLTHVAATGHPATGHPGPEHARTLRLARTPVTVAELAARLRLPVAVAKVVVSDLVEAGLVLAEAPSYQHTPTDPAVLRQVRDELRRRL